jgi:hypothetical protein
MTYIMIKPCPICRLPLTKQSELIRTLHLQQHIWQGSRRALPSPGSGAPHTRPDVTRPCVPGSPLPRIQSLRPA